MYNQHILSDLDGTVQKKSLVLKHAVLLHNHKVLDLGDLVHQWEDRPKDETLIQALAQAYQDGIIGKTADELGVTEYLSQTFQEKDFYSTLARLTDAHARGAEVTIISGSPSFLVEGFAKNFGFQGIGTDYHTDEHGRFVGTVTPMFNAESKRAYVNTLNLSEKTIHAYGDTCSDLPLFEVAEWGVLVDPTQETLAALTHSVHEIIYH